MGVFPPGTPVFPFIPWDVWNWKPSSFFKIGSTPPHPPFFSLPPPPLPLSPTLPRRQSKPLFEVKTIPCQHTLQPNNKTAAKGSDHQTCVPPVHQPCTQKFNQSNWSLLQSRTEVAKIFSQPPLIAYKRPLHYM